MSGLRNIDPLPGTRVEVKEISELLLQYNWSAEVKLARDAREQYVKAVQSPKVLHIATHGFFLEGSTTKRKKRLGIDAEQSYRNPLLRSGLLLAGVSAPIAENEEFQGNEDGILTAYEASDLNLDKTELVVLSACETGLGEIVAGEGVYGLQRAFQVAGARSLIISLWAVSDEATQTLMTSFYQYWLSHPTEGKQAAFHKAQQAVRKKYPAPYYWGAFLLLGE